MRLKQQSQQPDSSAANLFKKPQINHSNGGGGWIRTSVLRENGFTVRRL